MIIVEFITNTFHQNNPTCNEETPETVPNTKIKAVPPFLDDFFNFLENFLSTLMEVEIEFRKAKPRNEELKKAKP